jgi:hypothetical protein
LSLGKPAIVLEKVMTQFLGQTFLDYPEFGGSTLLRNILTSLPIYVHGIISMVWGIVGFYFYDNLSWTALKMGKK